MQQQELMSKIRLDYQKLAWLQKCSLSTLTLAVLDVVNAGKWLHLIPQYNFQQNRFFAYFLYRDHPQAWYLINNIFRGSKMIFLNFHNTIRKSPKVDASI